MICVDKSQSEVDCDRFVNYQQTTTSASVKMLSGLYALEKVAVADCLVGQIQNGRCGLKRGDGF